LRNSQALIKSHWFGIIYSDVISLLRH
jgi:hypothetical protein